MSISISVYHSKTYIYVWLIWLLAVLQHASIFSFNFSSCLLKNLYRIPFIMSCCETQAHARKYLRTIVTISSDFRFRNSNPTLLIKCLFLRIHQNVIFSIIMWHFQFLMQGNPAFSSCYNCKSHFQYPGNLDVGNSSLYHLHWWQSFPKTASNSVSHFQHKPNYSNQYSVWNMLMCWNICRWLSATLIDFYINVAALSVGHL